MKNFLFSECERCHNSWAIKIPDNDKSYSVVAILEHRGKFKFKGPVPTSRKWLCPVCSEKYDALLDNNRAALKDFIDNTEA